MRERRGRRESCGAAPRPCTEKYHQSGCPILALFGLGWDQLILTSEHSEEFMWDGQFWLSGGAQLRLWGCLCGEDIPVRPFWRDETHAVVEERAGAHPFDVSNRRSNKRSESLQKQPRSGRLVIARHFSGGLSRDKSTSAVGTTELMNRLRQLSSSIYIAHNAFQKFLQASHPLFCCCCLLLICRHRPIRRNRSTNNRD